MSFKSKTLLLGDFSIACLAFHLAVLARFGFKDAHVELFSKPFLRIIIISVVLITVSYVFDLYSLDKQRNRKDVLKKIILSVGVSFLGFSAIVFLYPEWMVGRGLLAISLALFICLQFVWHLLHRMLFHLPYLAQNIIVVGTDQDAARIGTLITTADDGNHSLKGFVSCPTCPESAVHVPQEMILGEMEHLLEIITRVAGTKLIITNPQHLQSGFFQNLLLNCKLLGVEISDVPSYFESVSGKLMLENMNMSDLIYSDGFRRSALVDAAKRVVDVMISLAGIVLMLPLLPLVILLVKLNSSGPVFYRQVRVGHMGKHFTLYKFRTMDQNAELDSGAVWAQANDPRIRPIGRFLRKSRLDELPQLFNVLIGKMSFIGPRPERPEFVSNLQELIPFYGKRHFLKPGVTGWAQVKYPYGASIEDSFEKLRYDLYYFKHMDPFLDTKIMLKTIKVIVCQFGGR